MARAERLNEAAPRTAAHSVVYVSRPKASDRRHYRKRLRMINRAAEDERWQTILNCLTYERADKIVPVLVPGESAQHPRRKILRRLVASYARCHLLNGDPCSYLPAIYLGEDASLLQGSDRTIAQARGREEVTRKESGESKITSRIVTSPSRGGRKSDRAG